MKKTLLLLVALLAGLSAWAQNAKLIRSGQLVQSFYGSSALAEAISAAEDEGDVIVLSSGNFSNPGAVTKSVSIYGQGMENSSAIGGAQTNITGKLEFSLKTDGGLDGIHLEGLNIFNDLNILTAIGSDAVVDGFTMVKCHAGGVFFYENSTNVSLQYCKFDRDVRCYPSAYTTTLQMDNCFVEGNFFCFADGSDVIANHCIIRNNNYSSYSGAFKYNNCIIYKNILGGATAEKCIFAQSGVDGTTVDCWLGVSNSDIFTASGEDASYSESKDFTVKEQYVGTDNTPVGLQGGLGWNKTPSVFDYTIPGINLTKDENGNYLIGSAEDWDAFAAIVSETPTANAKMTADVDLGDDQTMIGAYSGTFDGQGHTLNINYTVNEVKCAPFRYISGATIRRIHVTGNITTTAAYTGGLVGSATGGGGLVEQNWSSVNVTCTNSSRFQSGLVGFVNVSGNNFVVTDNIVDGNQTGKSSENWGGCIGLRDSGPTTLSNNLITAHFNVGGYSNATQQCWNQSNFTISNNYAIESLYYVDGSDSKTKYITEEQLADGTIATALQAGRDEEIWVQDETNGSPMLKVFLQDDMPTNIVDITETAWPKRGQRYNILGQPVDENYKGIVIENGRKIIVR